MKNKRLDEKNLVVESNELIEAHYRLGAQEQKIVLSVISMIKTDSLEFEEYFIPVSFFKSVFDVKGNAYGSRLKKSAKGLIEKSLQIRRKGGGWLVVSWFSSIEEYPEKGEVGFCFDPKLKPYLLSLKRKFTSYQLINAVQLRSGYSIRIYQLLKQYKNTVAKTREIEFIELRKILGIENKFKMFGDFKRKVLEVAKKEISESTDIRFSYSTRKIERRVNWIIFFIYPKNDNSKHIPDELFELLPEKERDDALEICNKIFEEVGEEPLRWMIEYTKSKKYQKFGSYLRFTYEKKLYDHHLEQKRLEEEILKKELAVAVKEKEKQLQKEQSDKNEIERENYLNDLINKLSIEDKAELNQRALKTLEFEATMKKGSKQTLERYMRYFNAKNNERALKCLYQYRLNLIEDFIREKK